MHEDGLILNSVLIQPRTCKKLSTALPVGSDVLKYESWKVWMESIFIRIFIKHTRQPVWYF